MKNKKNGFTLMEMLIVVAIIAVLVAIAIPTFSGSLDKAKKASCMANRRALKAKFSTEYMLGEKDFEEDKELSLSEEEAKTYKCPSGGTITYILSGGNFTVKCSIHDKDGTEISATIGDKISTILGIFSSSTTSSVDSLADSANVNNAKAELEKQGIDLDAMGAKSWRYDKNGGKPILYWTNADISSLSDGTEIPVIRYNSADGTYTVLFTKVTSNKNGVKTYNIIGKYNASQYSASASASAAEKTYENAQKWLEEAQNGKR